jgi:hypothetical protein
VASKRKKSKRASSAPSGGTVVQDLNVEAARTPRTKAPSRATWKIMDRGSSVAAALLATRASAVAWRVVTGRKPPTSGRHPDVTTREAVTWAVVGGSIVELVRVGVRRGAATYWVRSTGQLPPGMKPLDTRARTARSSGTTKEPVLSEPAPVTSTKKVSRRSRGR